MNKWEIVRLGDVCTGKITSIAQKDLADNDGDYPIHGASGLIKYVDFYKYDKPYVAVVKDGAGVGRVSHMPAKSSVIGTMQYILPGESIESKFLYYVMSNMKLARFYTGSTIPHIYFKDYKKELIPLPPLPAQQKIVDVLDRVCALIEKRKVQIKKFDLLVKSQFVEMFSDTDKFEQVTVDSACTRIIGGGTPSKSKPEYYTGEIPWITPKDMKSALIMDSIDHITEEAVEKSAVKIIPAKSVLMVIRSGILKHTLPVAINTVPVTINQDMKAFIVSNRIIPEFLMYTFEARKNELLSNVRAVTADNIEFGIIRNLMICLPPIELQKNFADFVKQANKSKFEMQRGLDKLELLYKSLMQKCFKGEVF